MRTGLGAGVDGADGKAEVGDGAVVELGFEVGCCKGLEGGEGEGLGEEIDVEVFAEAAVVEDGGAEVFCCGFSCLASASKSGLNSLWFSTHSYAPVYTHLKNRQTAGVLMEVLKAKTGLPFTLSTKPDVASSKYGVLIARRALWAKNWTLSERSMMSACRALLKSLWRLMMHLEGECRFTAQLRPRNWVLSSEATEAEQGAALA